jgi:hypothetical protein
MSESTKMCDGFMIGDNCTPSAREIRCLSQERAKELQLRRSAAKFLRLDTARASGASHSDQQPGR